MDKIRFFTVCSEDGRRKGPGQRFECDSLPSGCGSRRWFKGLRATAVGVNVGALESVDHIS